MKLEAKKKTADEIVQVMALWGFDRLDAAVILSRALVSTRNMTDSQFKKLAVGLVGTDSPAHEPENTALVRARIFHEPESDQ